jgi:protein-S-isoprenylcysteine O-methyltransferase Ste14
VRPLPFAWPHAALFWGVYVWAFLPEMRIVFRSGPGAAKADSRDAGSLRFILAGIWIALLIAFPLASFGPTQFPAGAQAACFFCGIGLLVTGSLLRRHCWGVLGEHFTGDVKADAAQPVIDRGAYAWVRHPSYLGAIVMFSGIGLALGNWASLLVVVAAAVAVYGYRIAVEERALEAVLGDRYRAYARRRRRLIPFIY